MSNLQLLIFAGCVVLAMGVVAVFGYEHRDTVVAFLRSLRHAL